MAAIKTSKTFEKINRPDQFGMHPKVSQMLRNYGVNPAEHIANARAVQSGSVHAGAQAAFAAKLAGLANDFAQFTLEPSDVTVAPLLNQAALMYESNEYIAEILCPTNYVDERSAYYKSWDRTPFKQLVDSRIGPSAGAKEVHRTLSDNTYSTALRALKTFVSNATGREYPTLNEGFAAVEQIMGLHALERETAVATGFNTAGNYASSNKVTLTSGGAGTNWGGSAADPIGNMLAMIEAILGPITHAAMSDKVWHKAQQNSALKTILASQLDNKGLLRPMDFGLYFGIPNVLISKADSYSTAGVRSRVWSEANLWLGSVNSAQDARTFARSFMLRQGAGGYSTKRWEEPDRGNDGGMWLRVAYEMDFFRVVDQNYGALIINVNA